MIVYFILAYFVNFNSQKMISRDFKFYLVNDWRKTNGLCSLILNCLNWWPDCPTYYGKFIILELRNPVSSGRFRNPVYSNFGFDAKKPGFLAKLIRYDAKIIAETRFLHSPGRWAISRSGSLKRIAPSNFSEYPL